MIQIFLENPLGQIFGLLGMGASFIGLLQKDDNNTIKIIIISSCFWVIHFYIMGVYSAMALSVVGVFRLFLSLRYKKNEKIFAAVLVSVLIAGFMTYENKLSFLPIVGSCISAYGYFFAEKFALRLFLFVNSILRLTFELEIGSIGGIINEIVAQLVLIYVMYRLIRESETGIFIYEKFIGLFRKKAPDLGGFTFISDYLRLFKKNTLDIIIQSIVGIKNSIKNLFTPIKKRIKS